MKYSEKLPFEDKVSERKDDSKREVLKVKSIWCNLEMILMTKVIRKIVKETRKTVQEEIPIRSDYKVVCIKEGRMQNQR